MEKTFLNFKFLDKWWPFRLFKEMEQNAYSVRQLIAQRERLFELLEFAGRIANFDNGNSLQPVTQQIRLTEAQFYQDIIALLLSRGRREGWFVEFGACDGVKISNTLVLEKEFGWKGILAEPGREWHADLKKNRSCHVDTRCIFSRSGERIPFYESLDNLDQSSAVSDHMNRRRTESYDVETITLCDLLEEYNAPGYIDFMSVDTEGTEYEILKSFPFNKYKFGLICVEHHLPEEEARMKELMKSHGYVQILRSISKFDGWYIPEDSVEVTLKMPQVSNLSNFHRM